MLLFLLLDCIVIHILFAAQSETSPLIKAQYFVYELLDVIY